MGLQVRRRLGIADAVTLCNAVVGFVAAVVAFTDPATAARLLLLAAVADGLDGIVARRTDNTAVGPLLDSITDVVSFGAAPGLFVYGVVLTEHAGLDSPEPATVVGLAVAAGFVVLSVVRTALYTVHVGDGDARPGIPNTLAATVLAAGYLAGVTDPTAVLVGTAVLSPLMIAPPAYPGLLARDAIALGSVQALAILAPARLARVFPRTLVIAALAYLVLGPRYYWG